MGHNTHFQKKNKNVNLFIQVPKQKSGKILKDEAAEPYLETCQISMMERFCENTTAKSFIIDVWYGSKYTTEVVQDSKINLKWMNTKMQEKTTFLQCGPCRGYLYVGIFQDITTGSLHMYYCIIVHKNLAKFTEAHLHRSLFSTFQRVLTVDRKLTSN